MSKPMNPIKFLKILFAKKEPVTIEAVGPSDLFGNAGAVLSDGSYRRFYMPAVGAFCGYNHREAKVVPLEESHGWRVTTADGEVHEVSVRDIEQAKRALKSPNQEV